MNIAITFWKSASREVLRWIYPETCNLCGTHQAVVQDLSLCKSCQSSLLLIAPPACRLCGAPIQHEEDSDSCPACLRRRILFTRCVATGRYTGNLRDLILRLKYRKERHVTRTLGALMARRLMQDSLIADVDLIVPVPMYWSQYLTRRYNHAELLAKEISQIVRLPLSTHTLRKTRRTHLQATLHRQERLRNLRQSFHVTRRKNIEGKAILLIDDVFTTGATASECAQVLYKAHARSVYVGVAAR